MSKKKENVMADDIFSGKEEGKQTDNRFLRAFRKKFVEVQNILDQNKLLINEINQNHKSKNPDNLARNVQLIRELNNNLKKAADIYADLSNAFARSKEAPGSGTSKPDTRCGEKRSRTSN